VRPPTGLARAAEIGISLGGMTEEHVSALASVPIFSGVSDAELAHIAELATEFEARSGHVLIERGQDPAGCFVLLDGTARVELADGGVIERGAGDFFGELAVLAESPRTARVMATSDVRGLAIRREDLLELIETMPTIAVAMLKAVAARFVESG
jgi:CRP/FNR family cyclic AMP-dependent transcriptional regulator